jgi:hypothetical protein
VESSSGTSTSGSLSSYRARRIPIDTLREPRGLLEGHSGWAPAMDAPRSVCSVRLRVFNFVLFLASSAPKQPIHHAPLSTIRGFSGHWMLFYGAAFAVMYSRIHAPQLYQARKCPQ